MKNDELEELLSFAPGKELRLMILREVKESGKSIGEVADRFAMPPIYILSDNNTFEYQHPDGTSETMNVAEFSKRWPHRRIIIIKH